MHTRQLRKPLAALAAAAVSAAALIGAGAAVAATPTVSVVARGLSSPRHLTFGPGGSLYVALAGTGGGEHAPKGQCHAGLGTRGVVTRFCVASDAGVDQITAHGEAVPLLHGLPSVVERDTGEVTGAEAVAFHGRYAVVLTGNVLSDAIGQSALSYFGGSGLGNLQGQQTIAFAHREVLHRDGRTIVKVVHYHRTLLWQGAGISTFAATHPQSPATLGGVPGDTPWASDPQDAVPYQGGYAIADTGADDLVKATLRSDRAGKVSLLARFATAPETAPAGALGPDSPVQSIDAQAAPSSVTVGPDGALYVAVTRALPGLPGTAEVDRVVPGQAPVPVVTGLTAITDLAFTKAGNLLILEGNTGGALAPADTGGALLTATLSGTTPATATNLDVPGLVDPGGLTIAPDGDAYITNDSSSTTKGEIIKVGGLG